jgi:hypothetical protein
MKAVRCSMSLPRDDHALKGRAQARAFLFVALEP